HEFQFPGTAEDGVPIAARSAAESVRRHGFRFERLLYGHAGFPSLHGAADRRPLIRSGQGAGAARSGAFSTHGRSARGRGAAALSPLLSVVIPCFNEAGKIEKDISAALDYFSGRTHSFELILVDDGSTDGTAEILGQAKACATAVCY